MSLDAKAVIDGITMDRVSQPSRWLFARQAILRQMIADRITRLVKVDTNLHVPDIFTKPVSDPAAVPMPPRLAAPDMTTARPEATSLPCRPSGPAVKTRPLLLLLRSHCHAGPLAQG